MALYESRLTDSLGPVNAKSLARDIARDKPLNIAAWVEARNITLLGDKTVKVLVDLYTEAAWYGVCIARAELDEARKSLKADNPELSVDWSGWVPGDPDAARLLLDKAGAGIQGLLDKASITIKGINDTRVSELGNLLARTVGEGASMGRTAAAIREMFGTGSSWARTVAQTETRRAVTAASVDTYKEAGVESVEWLTAWGEACPICLEFQSMGPVLIGSGAFDGDDGPPGHPNCFCVVLPVIDPELLRPVSEEAEAEEISEEGTINFGSGNEDDAHVYAVEHAPELTDFQIKAIARYQAEYYTDINSYMRYGTKLPEDIKASEIPLINSAIKRGSFPDPVTVYRGVLDESGYLQNLQIGDVITDQGFTSTSLNRDVSEAFALGQGQSGSNIVFEIDVPARTPCLPADAVVNSEPDEWFKEMMGYSRLNEVIFPRNTSMRITNVDRRGDTWVVRAEVVT